ncbi:hypothetical protein, unlikely [Trypanosoma congolense IL3000]|uniref:Uncharacterized protein n=1 Tax=Trypanosoma congolense (strain IL3000) TaxID=1068625 RepID=F9WF72_TRYCI|nr:hypothetical protein, unlikely [Trypanosoma congolense IL3000]
MSVILLKTVLAPSPHITPYLAALCGSLLNIFGGVPSPPQSYLCHVGGVRNSRFVTVSSLPTCWLSPMPAVTPLDPVPVGTCHRRDGALNAAWSEPTLRDLRPPFRTVPLTTSVLVCAPQPISKAVSSCTSLHCSLQAANL